MQEELTIKQAAELLGVNRETIARWIRDGRIPAVNVSGGSERPRWRIARATLDGVRRGRERALGHDAAGAVRRLRRVEAKMVELQALLREVRELVDERRQE